MGPSASLSNLLRSLCRNTPWKYAVFWKLKRRNGMTLVCEEGYYEDSKSSVPLDCSTDVGFLNVLSSLKFEMDENRGSCTEYSLHVAVSNMASRSYSLGEGIVGKVASTEKHRWILVLGSSSKPSSSCPEEWQPQVAAGIKTVLLVPLHNGVVQLGSLEKVPEDLKVVSQIKDAFSSPRDNPEGFYNSRTSADTSTFLTAPSRSLSPLGDNCSLQLQPESDMPIRKDPLVLDIKQAKMNERPNIHYPHNLLLPFDNLDSAQLSGSEMHHLLEADAEVESPGSSLKSTCNANLMSTQDSECQNFDTVNSFMVECKSSNWSPEDVSFISSQINDVHQFSFSEQPTFYDLCDTEIKHVPLNSCYIANELVQPYGAELDDIYGHRTNVHDRNEVHRFGLPDESYDYIWDSVENFRISSSNIPFSIEDTDFHHYIGLEHGELLINTCEPGQLSDTAITNFYSALDERSPTSRCTGSPSNSSEDIVGSCLTQAKYEHDVLETDLLPTKSNAKPTLKSDILTCSESVSPSKKGSIIGHDEKHCTEMKYETCETKSSHADKRKTKSTDTQKPRPRDRQLIQDRVKELRELVPNGNKCSIDALLDRTVRHMTFLRSVSSQADKLKKYAQSRRRVRNEEDLDSFARQVPQNNGTWAYEVGGQQSESCPIIVENIDQQGHMLVEMLCAEYGDFLEIAQVLRRLDLTILKGIMESRDQDLWAHFVVEGSRGFNRMEILWHLMQLLQQNRISIPSRLW